MGVVEGKNRRERGKPISSWVVMVMQGSWVGGFSVSHRGQCQTGLTCFSAVPQNTQLRGPFSPRNTTLWRGSPAPLSNCTWLVLDQNRITRTKSCFSRWWPFCSGSAECGSMGEQPYCLRWELLTEETIKPNVCYKRYRFSRLVRNEMDAQGYNTLSL